MGPVPAAAATSGSDAVARTSDVLGMCNAEMHSRLARGSIVVRSCILAFLNDTPHLSSSSYSLSRRSWMQSGFPLRPRVHAASAAMRSRRSIIGRRAGSARTRARAAACALRHCATWQAVRSVPRLLEVRLSPPFPLAVCLLGQPPSPHPIARVLHVPPRAPARCYHTRTVGCARCTCAGWLDGRAEAMALGWHCAAKHFFAAEVQRPLFLTRRAQVGAAAVPPFYRCAGVRRLVGRGVGGQKGHYSFPSLPLLPGPLE
jgi:hypothetical protein